jgi:hypothetical protein
MIPVPLGPIYTNDWPNIAGDPLIETAYNMRHRAKREGTIIALQGFLRGIELMGWGSLAGPTEIHNERGDFALRRDEWGCLELEAIRQASRSAANRFGDDDDARFRG